MILSMTGCGEAQGVDEGVSYALVIRSLNNRYFKASIKLPEALQFAEEPIEKLLRQEIRRGTIHYQVRARSEDVKAVSRINREALRSYIDEALRGYAEAIRGHAQAAPDHADPGAQGGVPTNIRATIDLATLCLLPGVCEAPDPDESRRERVTEVLLDLTRQALASLQTMRRAEGEALYQDVAGHCQKIRERLVLIRNRASHVVVEYQERLRERVNRLLQEARVGIDADTLMREVAIYADRSDINEEVSRLSSHLDQFLAACRTEDQVGRKLDFLAQEMLREANTIGSKSNDVEIAHGIVEIKSLIDRLKEQVQNVE